MAITAERFQEFAELFLAAYNSVKTENASLKDQLGSCPAQLAEALANDAADAATIAEAQAAKVAAEENLATLSAKSEADNQALLDAIAKLQSDLGLSLPSFK